MHRKSFLGGMLSGLILGVSAMLVVQFVGQSRPATHAQPSSTASQPVRLPGELRVYPGPAVRVPGEPVPPNWRPQDFNGVRYYIAPLGCTNPR